MAQSTYFTTYYILEILFVAGTVEDIVIRQYQVFWFMTMMKICLVCVWMLSTTLHARLNFWTQINGMKWVFYAFLKHQKIYKWQNLFRYGPGYKDPFNFQARLPNLYRVPVPTPRDQWDQIWQSIPYLGVDIPPQASIQDKATNN